MTTLAIDPGARIGWALFGDQGDLLSKGVMNFEQFSHSLHYKPNVNAEALQFNPRDPSLGRVTFHIDHVVYESFFLDPGTSQGGSTGPTQEVIGVLKYLCLQAGIRPTAQRAAVLPVAMKHCGYAPPVTKTGNKKHLPDEDSAWLHGMEYFISKGTIRPPHDVSATL